MNNEILNMIARGLIETSNRNQIISFLTKISLFDDYPEDIKFKLYYTILTLLIQNYDSTFVDPIFKTILPILYNTAVDYSDINFNNNIVSYNLYSDFFKKINLTSSNKKDKIVPVIINNNYTLYSYNCNYIPNSFQHMITTPINININNLNDLGSLKNQLHDKYIIFHNLVYTNTKNNEIIILMEKLKSLDIIPKGILSCVFLYLNTSSSVVYKKVENIFPSIPIDIIHLHELSKIKQYLTNKVNNSKLVDSLDTNLHYIINKIHFYGMGVPDLDGNYNSLPFLNIDIKDISSTLIQVIAEPYLEQYVLNNFSNIKKYKLNKIK